VNVYQAFLAALNRTPEEDQVFWMECQRREYRRWWRLEDIVTDLGALGAEDDESAELVAQARPEQLRIHGYQAERGEIRDRICDDNEGH
jgi:hypothetical protein